MKMDVRFFLNNCGYLDHLPIRRPYEKQNGSTVPLSRKFFVVLPSVKKNCYLRSLSRSTCRSNAIHVSTPD
ncbi:hypothetical protein TNCT_637691 [Trichonephila clavata]|uniref:Uncharacterized protein n=1 Tax=Trichonephila clavata TaxID=2740835 RepID=A0A8X6GSF8_TRICU|nr:hypothetical protein TNCT_637691 [Trichonephila clavata]